MEPVGLAVGVVELAGIFSTCIDAIERFDSLRNFSDDSKILFTLFQGQAMLVKVWVRAVGFESGAVMADHSEALDDPGMRSVIYGHLSIIEKLLVSAASIFSLSEETRATHTPSAVSAQSRFLAHENVPSKSTTEKVKWALRDKKKCKELAEDLKSLVQDLYSLVPVDGVKGTKLEHSNDDLAPIDNMPPTTEFSKASSPITKPRPELLESSRFEARYSGQIEIRDACAQTSDFSQQLIPTTPTWTSRTTVHGSQVPVQIAARRSQASSIQFSAPPQFHCSEVGCPCRCHLGKYVKTPLFLKKFVGALSFRGTCRNHALNLWELKYWIPEWISNYNVYLLFERTACGSPSLGLRFQRKVPWGAEDTIIRFALVRDIHGIRSILQNGIGSLDDIDPNHGRTALHYSVVQNDVEGCKLLLEAGADRFIEDERNMSATQIVWEHVFTKRGPPEVLKALEILFPNDDLDFWMFTPLHKAVINIEGFHLPTLLDPESTTLDIDARDVHQRTALHWASLRGDLNAVETLLDAGASAIVIDGFKCTPLLYAVSAAVPRIVERLILSGANVNVANDKGDSALHYAARHKNELAMVETLVRAGAEIDRKNAWGNTPFVGAAIKNRVAIGRYLLKRGADRYNRNKYGDTPIRETIHHNCHEFLQMLLEDKTTYDDINKHGSSLLHAVALEGDMKTVQILKAADLNTIDIDLRNDQGNTAMDACQKRIRKDDGFQDGFVELLHKEI